MEENNPPLISLYLALKSYTLPPSWKNKILSSKFSQNILVCST
ncbi:hypothetical protein NIES37_22340 [Tolypothrix tenuis PCC 7101]|uniref:Uncharacterized protein n=1 Tax=Tolypothrix tenuis PCC 7101 TaxID=231146 RepID=A0A1Z4MXS6_9CYAN|nr:hypothetical protein NIES37_22340 [Tolypothrix tenuis PCC 7101]BAZ77796.1 hypothetical protein NIES50_64280 [Aulosira laxa NIES-50]